MKKSDTDKSIFPTLQKNRKQMIVQDLLASDYGQPTSPQYFTSLNSHQTEEHVKGKMLLPHFGDFCKSGIAIPNQ